MRTATALVLIASLLASSTAVAWSGKGSYEPSLKRDQTDGWMWTTPDTLRTDANPALRKVYFNGFIGQYAVGATSFFPNSGQLRSGLGPNTYYFVAMLGVWKDCNRDGYVGYGDQGLFEYRVELLPDTTVCKPVTTPTSPTTGRVTFDWFPSHNDGQWVREFLPISWNRGNAEILGDVDPFNVNANDTRVWTDVGLPESGGGASRTCEYTTYTMTRSTGGLIRWADCFRGYAFTDALNSMGSNWTPCTPTTPPVCQPTGVGIDGLGAGQLSFRDKPREQDQSASQLNRPNPYGRESDASFVEAWDCTSPQLFSQKVSDTAYVNVSRPRTSPSANLGGSASGTANSTASGFDECKRTTTNNGHTAPNTAIGSHWGRTAANAPYDWGWLPLIGSSEGNLVLPVKAATDVMLPGEGQKPSAPFGAILGRGTAGDLGTRITSLDGFWYAPGRTSVPITTTVLHLTYYAYVSPATVSKYGLSLPKGATTGVYGAGACPTIGAGAPDTNNWACDPTKWWVGAEGQDIEPRGDGSNGSISLASGTTPAPKVGARVGSPFNLRDIDCYDQSAQALRPLGVHTGTLSSATGGSGATCDVT